MSRFLSALVLGAALFGSVAVRRMSRSGTTIETIRTITSGTTGRTAPIAVSWRRSIGRIMSGVKRNVASSRNTGTGATNTATNRYQFGPAQRSRESWPIQNGPQRGSGRAGGHGFGCQRAN